MLLFDTIEETPVVLCSDISYLLWGEAMIDSDGTGSSHGDPDQQAQTSYEPYLNADLDKYIVLPPQLFAGVKPMVLGCKVEVLNLTNGLYTDAVVGDQGPSLKIGEMSIATAKALGIPSSPTTGGVSTHTLLYRIYPGIPARVGNKVYSLQSW
jgi:hypothetical protein